jgi:predicted nucleic acid-binding protein
MALVIADAGPIIALANIQQLQLLKSLFTEVTLPNAVWLETQAKDKQDSQLIREARESGWLRVVNVDITQHFPRSLHDGENEALQLARNEQDTLLILDDQLARREAARLGLQFIGTVKVLSLAQQQGLIEDVMICIEAMQKTGYRVSAKFLKN